MLSRGEIYEKVEELEALGGRQVLMQGGHHPRVLSEWWGQLISDLKERFPTVNSHALSAPELDHFSQYEKRPVEEVIRDLKDAGLGSVPGAGAEMLVERVRKIIAPKKTTTDRWLDVHRKVHEAGLRSSATMMFGHVETAAERVEHLQRVRDLQDETGGFTAFISWTCQPDGTPREQDYPEKATPAVYLRVQALPDLPRQRGEHPDELRHAEHEDGQMTCASAQRLRRDDDRGERRFGRGVLPPRVGADGRALIQSAGSRRASATRGTGS